MSDVSNSVRLMGRLGHDPEIHKFGDNHKVAKLSIATNDVYRNENGEKANNTQWHRLVMWGKNAENAEKFLKKGSEIAIEGKLINNSYTNKEGEKVNNTEVRVNTFQMLGRKNDISRSQEPADPKTDQKAATAPWEGGEPKKEVKESVTR